MKLNNRRGNFSRSKRSATKVAGTVLILMLTAASAWAFNPPRIIGVLSARPNRTGFARDFCWVDDQNSDGYDDLLVNELTSISPPNRVYLFQGGDTVRDEAAFTYTSTAEGLVIGRGVFYIGNLRGENNPPLIGICSYYRSDNRIVSYQIDLYERLSHPENNPVMTLTRSSTETAVWHQEGFRNRPIDFNGDGFQDIAFTRFGFGFLVYYGGEVIDTIADWRYPIGSAQWSCGLDVNGDDYGDILMYSTENDTSWYSLFFGGDDPDTLPAVRIRALDYDLTEHFALLPDINGDGYDEWGIYWNRGINEGGFHIFLGSEEPDGVPDVRLEGTRFRWKEEGRISGGDFNGDGFGDIVTTTSGGPDGGEYSELMIHFGNRWLRQSNEIHRSDIYLDMSQVNDGIYPLYGGSLGAVGDYNGDSVEDFIWGGSSRRVIVFSGDRDWRLNAPIETIIPTSIELLMSITPNPFNNQFTIDYSLSHKTEAAILVVDVTGRELRHISQGVQSAGNHNAAITGLPAGLYFVALQTPQKTLVMKAICLK